MMRRLSMIAAVLVAAGTVSFPRASMTQSLPTPFAEEVLVKTSLLTLNDANLTGNYTILHAKMAKAFRERFTAERLKQAFKVFAGQHMDVIAAQPIVPTTEAKINNDGTLMLRGYFDTSPNRVSYELDFVSSEGEWKMISINVKGRPAATSDVAGSNLVARIGVGSSIRETKAHP